MTVQDYEEPQFETYRDYLDPEVELPKGEGDLRVGVGRTDPELLEALLEMRKKFVVEMKWFSPQRPGGKEHDDWDRYDEVDSTLHLALFEENTPEIIAGMRLTPIDSVRESLSWSMLETHALMVKKAEQSVAEDGSGMLDYLDQVAGRGNLWDLTRLVNTFDEKHDLKHVVGAMIELFSVSAELTARHVDQEGLGDVKWVFTTTDALKSMLDRVGVLSTVITSGTISSDDESVSHFCVVEPLKSIEHVYRNSEELEFSLKRMEDGLRKAYAL